MVFDPRVPISILLLTAGTGCSTTCEDRADWSIHISKEDQPQFGHDELQFGIEADRAPDGTIFVALLDSGLAITFGDKTVRDPSIARVDSSGSVLGLTKAPEGTGRQLAAGVRVSDRGTDVLVKWAEPDSIVASYDENLTLRWTQTLPDTTNSSLFEVGPSGETVAVTQRSSPTVYYVTADGALRWQIQLPSGLIVPNARIAENGDVFVFGVGRRFRLAAADGATLEDVPSIGIAYVGGRDGSYVSVDYSADYSRLSKLTSYASNGQTRWTAPLDAKDIVGNALVAPNGDVLALLATDDYHADLFTFDAATGAVKRRLESCHDLDIFRADDVHYYGIGHGRAESAGLARFANR